MAAGEPPAGRRKKAVVRYFWLVGGAIFFLAVGVSYSVYVYGLRPLDPTNISILPEDPAQSYMGWLFFRHEPRLTWPLGWSSALGYPKGEPIAYLDSIPLVATLLWPFRHWLPEPFQYLTLWWTLCATLSFYFGSRICRRLCGGDWVAGTAGGLLFLAAPVLLLRAAQDFALASHWFVLAALEFYLTCSARLSWRHISASVAIAAVAGGINPYIAVLSLSLIGAGYLRSTLTASEDTQRLLGPRLFVALTGMICAVTAMLLSWLLFGFLRPNDPGAYAGIGYGLVSMNLLAPIDPMFFPALLLRQQSYVSRFQVEGYNYFGLGVLLLGFAVLIRQPRMVLAHLFQRDAWPGWLVFVACTLLALTLKATVGSHVIYDLHAPPPIVQVLSAFRASGRLFWPAFYLALAGIVSAAFIVFGRYVALACVCAFAVQIVDLRGLRKEVRHTWSSTPIGVFSGTQMDVFTNGPVWQDIAHRYRHLVVMPAWQCEWAHETPGGEFGYWIFGKLAGEHRMSLNSFYAGRTSPSQIDYFCQTMPADLQQSGLANDTAYVFQRAAHAYAIPHNEHACRVLDGVILCVKAGDAQGFGQDLSAGLIELPIGTWVSIGQSTPLSDQLFGFGWDADEAWGRWTSSHEADLSFLAPGTGAVRLELVLNAFAPATHPQHAQISVNGRHMKDWLSVDGSDSTVGLDLPADLIGPDRVVTLKFILPDAVSPAELGISDDTRRIAVGLKSLRLNAE